MLLNFKSVLLGALLASSAHRVDAHSIELLSCLTTTGNLRVFVRHWHNDHVYSVDDADEMVIDGTALPPVGLINDVATLVSPWPELFATGCSTPIVQENSCPSQLSDDRNDYVWYDFPTQCDVPVSYVFDEGTTYVLQDGCTPPYDYGGTPMYPTTISGTFADTSPPVISVNGEECPSTFIRVIRAQTRDCDDKGVGVRFKLSAEDDCDPNPSISSDPPSGSFFEIGSTLVTVTSTDAAGNESTCTFVVMVSQDPDDCQPTASPVRAPTPPPTPPQTECLGCNFFSSVLGRPTGPALDDWAKAEPAPEDSFEVGIVEEDPAGAKSIRGVGPTPYKIVCEDGQDPVPDTFCGRGPDRKDCGIGEYCFTDPLDRFAVCCPSTTSPGNFCGMQMAGMVIRGQSGRCSKGSIFQRECQEYPCSFQATFQVRIINRSCRGGCKLVVWDDSEQVIAVSIATSSHGQWLSFSYEMKRKCECRTHRIKAAFSCPGRPQPYVLTQRAEYTCSECEKTLVLG